MRFAKKWAEVTDIDFEQALLTKTSIYRRVEGMPYRGEEDHIGDVWKNTFSDELTEDELTDSFFDAFMNSPQAIFRKEESGFGSFGYDYVENNKSIKMHFVVTQRGPKSLLADEFKEERHADLVRMFSSIKEKHPEADRVIGGSWLYNLAAYTKDFPPEFTDNMREILPPDLSFRGDSLWGQFIDSTGYIKEETMNAFLDKVDAVQNEKDLLKAFPLLPLFAEADIETFYNFCEI